MAKTIEELAAESQQNLTEVIKYLQRWGWMQDGQITDLGNKSGVFQPVVVDGAAEVLLKVALNNPHPISNNQMIKTLDGHYVESRGEAMIDDWLYAHGIEHEVQVLLPFFKSVYLRRADFYLPKQNKYIEYWGGNTFDYLAEKERRKEQYAMSRLERIDIEDADIQNLSESPLKQLISEETLRQRLREYRAKRAKENGVAHFKIFEDSVLETIVAKKPRRLEDFIEISGIGKKRLLDFGEDLTAIVNEVC
ncbi:HRDC domain-containing protein [Sulfoacidibacillus thermotolerans]|uniref:HRDC domain-containing protein n=1 Tax=Sulfoacidibacillus thermotolerans TaxID=1765684 RepID=A0A2U3CQE4_SULT2|nr:HRDC domain-containing protein [Sulfoacidibacillus thermotolerans]PWI51256.1 hypothetical protein BM613_14305 [Sulfoacidibacillus thermotolerans]